MSPGFQLLDARGLLVRTVDGENVILCEPLVYVSRTGETIVVHPGTTSDGPSIPRLFANLICPFGPKWLPAVLHDYLYRFTQIAKEDCDLVFKEALEVNGVCFIEQEILYRAVHDFGQSSFNADRAAQVVTSPTTSP